MRIEHVACVTLVSFAGLVSSCAPGEGAGSPPAAACVPDEAGFDEVRPIIERDCGACHGASPSFGAPYGLLDYAANIEGREGERPVDRIVARLQAGTMPPPGQPSPTYTGASAVVSWASCGAETEVDVGTNVETSAPVFAADGPAPDGMPHFDLLAAEFEVAAGSTDLYRCFVFDVPVDAPRYIRRLEMVVDEARVVHHATMYRDPLRAAPGEDHPCYSMPRSTQYLYAWAPGQPPLEFADGGFKVDPGDRFIVQVHYNNAAGWPDVQDSSGVRIYHGPPDGPEIGLAVLGPLSFRAQPNSRTTVSSVCNLRQDIQIIGSGPHMHQIGFALETTVEHPDGSQDTVISLENWKFESQLVYETPMQLKAGDRLITSCVFDNPYLETVRSGTGTREEMCFNFMYHSPPLPLLYCDDGSPNTFEQVDNYVPGACGEGHSPSDVPVARGNFVIGEPSPPVGGELVDGVYPVSEMNIYLDDADLGPGLGVLDLNSSSLTARGSLVIEGTRGWIDIAYVMSAVTTDDAAFSLANSMELAGDYELDGETGVRVNVDCPEDRVLLPQYNAVDDEILLQFVANQSGLSFLTEVVFRRQ